MMAAHMEAWEGKRLDDMDADELRAALRQCGEMYVEVLTERVAAGSIRITPVGLPAAEPMLDVPSVLTVVAPFLAVVALGLAILGLAGR